MEANRHGWAEGPRIDAALQSGDQGIERRWGEEFCYMGLHDPARELEPAQQELNTISQQLKEGEPQHLPKLIEIASRGFTLGALLELQCILLNREACEDIYGLLPNVLQHGEMEMADFPDLSWYDPNTSTTKEVVYRAITRLTRKITSSNKSMSTIMTGGRCCFPRCLISHTWGNVFTHTIAACVADALGDKCYFHLVPRLQEFEGVRALIHELGHERLMMTYWICALPINQHTVACDKCEPVEWQCTACGVGKITSGPQSEIGAFDIMMRVLAACDSQFYQVVAVDKQAIVVNRVWVVAEIAEAIQQQLTQHIIPHFPLPLSDYSMQQKMKVISVETCKATEPADKVFVLSRILDKPAYDENVRKALNDIQSQACRRRIAMLLAIILVAFCLAAGVSWAGVVSHYGVSWEVIYDAYSMFMTFFGLHTLFNVLLASKYHYIFMLLENVKRLHLYN
jgi:hypothetical protein